MSITTNCVPACLSCNGLKSDADAFDWYRRQRFYDPRRSMAIRAWMDGDLSLALRLLQWVQPTTEMKSNHFKAERRQAAVNCNDDFKLQAA